MTEPLGLAARSRERRAEAAAALGVLFAAGATFGLVANLVLGTTHTHTLAIALVAASGYPVAGALYLARRHVADQVLHGVLALGSTMVAAGAGLTQWEGPKVATGFFYVWVASYAAYFMSRRALVLHGAYGAGAFGWALDQHRSAAAVSEWLLVVGSALTVGAVVRVLTERLEKLANLDRLTGLPNRNGLGDHLTRAIARTGSPSALSVAMLDLDGFKEFNDKYGHLEGDRCLADLANCWREQLRCSDFLARFGGDEFVMVLPGTRLGQAADIVGSLKTPRDLPVRYSAGLTTWHEGEDENEVLARADAALYRAKREHRSVVWIS